jgi:adenylate cyclase
MARMRHPLLVVGSLPLLVAALWYVFYVLLSKVGLLVSLAYPFFSVAIGFLIFQSWYVLMFRHDIHLLERAFASYVSPELVKRIITDPNILCLEGERRLITIMFTDIRGFTPLAESLPPEQLVRLLNRYMDTMTEIVLREQGMLAKYIGDGIMAIYNAPLDVAKHAERAAYTALLMLRALHDLNFDFIVQYGVKLRIGIGIHTGEAHVGNMGSTRRFDYTAIGDAVNLAQGLEQSTKLYGVPIVISDTTRKALGNECLCRRLDRVCIKGRTHPVEVYQLMELLIDLDDHKDRQELVRDYEAALSSYFSGRFQEALGAFVDILHRWPEDGPSRVLAVRCQNFIKQPPPQWEGVFMGASTEPFDGMVSTREWLMETTPNGEPTEGVPAGLM